MKIIISENKMEKLVNSTIGYNLSDKIEMIDSWEGAPVVCRYMFPGKERFNELLNNWGPMYWFKTPSNGMWLAQQRENRIWYIYGKYYNEIYGDRIDEYDLLYYMDLDVFGLPLGYYIEHFVKEEN